MKKLALFAFTLLSAWAMTAKTITGPVDYVSPLVGTQSKHALSTGNTYPAIALPWGMNFCCLLYTSPSPRDGATSRMPSSA